MRTLWKAQLISPSFIQFVCISVILIFITMLVFINIKNGKRIVIRGICILVVLSIICLDVYTWTSFNKELHYAEENKQIVEGTIDNFVTDINGAESFTVNNIFFSYPISDDIIGYNIPKRDRKGVISGEGQYVRITYYVPKNNNVNIIVKIEERTGESSVVLP